MGYAISPGILLALLMTSLLIGPNWSVNALAQSADRRSPSNLAMSAPLDSRVYDPDFPTAETGKTRPAESPVSKGVEHFNQAFNQLGMTGAAIAVEDCYQGAFRIDKPAGRRIALERCAAMDIAANLVDTSVRQQMNFPPAPGFEPGRTDERVARIRDQRFEGMNFPIYRKNLEDSVVAWLMFNLELNDVSDNFSTPAPPRTSTPPAAAAPAAGGADQLYDEAIKKLQEGDYAAAGRGFVMFIQRYPHSKLAGNAQYWLGESYYARRDYNSALMAFAEGDKVYKMSPKGPDNLLKLGITLAVLGRQRDACAAFARFGQDYPRATDLQKGRIEQERLKNGCK